MKKLSVIFMIVGILGLMIYCGGGATKPSGTPATTVSSEDMYPKIKVIDHATGSADWINLLAATETVDGKKYKVFVAEGVHPDKQVATEKVKGEAMGMIASAIKVMITKEFATAFEADAESKDEITKGVTAYLARNVNVSGAEPVAMYWELKAKKDSPTAPWKKEYHVYMKYRIPIEEYEKWRAAAWGAVKPKVKLNPKLEKKADEVLKGMYEADKVEKGE